MNLYQVALFLLLTFASSTYCLRDQSCTFCGLVVSVTEQHFNHDSKNITQIENALHQMCSQLPTVAVTPCDNWVANNLGAVINAVKANVVKKKIFCQPSRDICKELKFCASSEEVTLVQKMESNLKNGSQLDCMFCKFGATIAEDIIEKEKWNATFLKNELSDFCEQLPLELKIPCEGFVYFKADAVINALENGASPDVVCEDLDLCPKNTTTVSSNIPLNPKREVVSPKPQSSQKIEKLSPFTEMKLKRKYY